MKLLCVSEAQTSAEGFVTNILGLFKRPRSARTRTEVRFSLERELEKSRCVWDGMRTGINFVYGIKITLVPINRRQHNPY